FVAEKGGALKWVDVVSGKSGDLLKLSVLTSSEEGLLGIAFHPKFKSNSKIYLNYVVDDGGDTTFVSEFEAPKVKPSGYGRPVLKRTLLKVKQPYSNHNAGQLAFGPDGKLYVGFGDGGWRDDPHENGQNGKTLL